MTPVPDLAVRSAPDAAPTDAAPTDAAVVRTALIVLSFNATADTIETLETVLRDKPVGVDVIVVDNASTDGAAETLRGRFPDVELVALSENRGWAGGNNAGIALALGRGYALVGLLNNDLSVPRGALATLIGTASELAPCVLMPTICAYDPPHSTQHGPWPGSSSIEAHPGVYPLGYAYGACLFVHAVIFRAVGVLDERFFLQLEETDFHERATRAGFKSYCTDRARVLHKESISFGGRVSPLKSYYIVRNTLLITEKNGGARWRLRGLMWFLRKLSGREGGVGRWLMWLASREVHAVAARRGVRDYALRRFGRIAPTSQHAIEAAARRSAG